MLERTQPSFVLLLLIAITATLNILIRQESGAIQVSLFIAALALVTYLCWASGMSLRSIGLTSGNPKKILMWSGGSVVLIFGLTVVAYWINSDWFQDDRYDKNLASTLLYIFIAIPLLTVFFEEFLFRGILWGYIRNHWDPLKATLGSSVLFGLWHVLAARGMDKSFLLDAGIPSAIAEPVLMIGTVIATSCAGIILCELRRRTDSLWVPVAVHWAINASAVAMAYLAWH